MKPTARRANIFREDLATEVILYDKASQQVHCLNKTVAIVWENADGTRSIDSLSRLVEEKLGVSTGRDLVLSSLDQLSKVGLLEAKIESQSEEIVSRRAIGKRLVMAGASAAMLPVLASIPVPAAAQSQSPSLAFKVENDMSTVLQELQNQPGVTFGTDSKGAVTCTGTTAAQKKACAQFGIANDAELLGASAAPGSTNQTNQYDTALSSYTNAAGDLGQTVPFVY